MVVMKAMGMQSDQEVVQMIGRDPRYSSLLLPSIEVTYIVLPYVLFPFTCFPYQDAMYFISYLRSTETHLFGHNFIPLLLYFA